MLSEITVSALRWLKRAKSNLIRAQMNKPEDVYWEDLCYDAQQCVEKSLKAFLILHSIKFRFVHDIGELLRNLKENGITYPDYFNKAVILTDFAVETRYPLITEPVSETEYKEAVEIAILVYNWVESQVNDQLKFDL